MGLSVDRTDCTDRDCRIVDAIGSHGFDDGLRDFVQTGASGGSPWITRPFLDIAVVPAKPQTGHRRPGASCASVARRWRGVVKPVVDVRMQQDLGQVGLRNFEGVEIIAGRRPTLLGALGRGFVERRRRQSECRGLGSRTSGSASRRSDVPPWPLLVERDGYVELVVPHGRARGAALRFELE